MKVNLVYDLLVLYQIQQHEVSYCDSFHVILCTLYDVLHLYKFIYKLIDFNNWIPLY
jgi:hypothetical protein